MELNLTESALALAATGFFVGLLVGMTGMGGGVIMTPILLIGFGMPPVHAVGTDLVFAAVTKIAGAWQHWRQGNVNFRLTRLLLYGSLPATIVAVLLLHIGETIDADATEYILEHVIAIALMIAATFMLTKVFGITRATESPRYGDKFPIAIVVIGAVGGLLVGLTSVGSGSMILALVVLFVPVSIAKLIGTDIMHAAVLVSVAALAHLASGNVELLIVGQLLIGSIPGVLIGSRISPKLPRRVLQLGLAGLLFTTAIGLLWPK